MKRTLTIGCPCLAGLVFFADENGPDLHSETEPVVITTTPNDHLPISVIEIEEPLQISP